MDEVWIFMVCVIGNVSGGELVCELDIELLPSYKACTSRQYEYQAEHFGEDFLTFCNPYGKPDIRV